LAAVYAYERRSEQVKTLFVEWRPDCASSELRMAFWLLQIGVIRVNPRLILHLCMSPKGRDSIAAQSQIPTGEWISEEAAKTFSLGQQVGGQLIGGEIILLSGPLGAGKTVFVKGLAAALGLDPAEVTSPTFTLVNPYSARLRLYHIDLYRLDEGASAAHAIDLDELLTDEKAVLVVEWAERLGRYPLPGCVWKIVISGDGDDPRSISIHLAAGER
jgi:tRNA threonylcarbamoyladenosine biosynthesis protein TsaE